jgi:hypothetical protein
MTVLDDARQRRYFVVIAMSRHTLENAMKPTHRR